MAPELSTRYRLVRERLPSSRLDPLSAARWLRGAPRAVALIGAWAGAGALLTSHPVRELTAEDDPFAALDRREVVVDTREQGVGGGWFGWFGFGLARAVEPTLPPPPPRPVPLPTFDLAFHDHVVRCDAGGRWWFEALWTPERAGVIEERREWWRVRLAREPSPARPFEAGQLHVVSPGTAGHAAAVSETVRRIAAGELSQVNLCLRLETTFAGDPLDLWLSAVAAATPAYAAYVSGGGRTAILSLSPELFLRRRARVVETRPIKGTAPLTSDPAALAGSAKDRAENVMIVDLMRNDLGRVCEYGSVEVPAMWQLEPAAGVWHLVSSVRGRLRPEVGDGALLRATFPPGSVTGAPKVQALRLIHRLEATGREAYCGAIGFCSPLAGLELNVAIRTLEVSREHLWLGAGGGVVSDSAPASEVREALVKAAGVAVAAGLTLDAEAVAGPTRPFGSLAPAPRPDPVRGVFETVLIRGGRTVDLADHLRRLQAAACALGWPFPGDVELLIAEAASAVDNGGARIDLRPGLGVEVSVRPLPPPGPMQLRPVVLPGGLGAHKWADRRLIESLSGPGITPLFCDLDGTVLEAGYAAVLILIDATLLAPPLDGRILPSLSRARALAFAADAGLRTVVRSFTLDEASAADAIVLCSSLRGPHPGVLEGGGPPATAAESVCALLSPQPIGQP